MAFSRRNILGLSVGIGASVITGSRPAVAAQAVLRPRQLGQLAEGRIDFHQHIIPPGYSDWLDQRIKQAFPSPKWSMEEAIAANDAMGNQGAYLSLSAPGVQFGNLKESRDYARRCNEYSAKISATRPDRFGWFAVLVLPDVEGSIAEAVYALDVLKADGVIVLANSWGGIYLGDASFDPLLEELNKRKTIMFVHPTQLWNSANIDIGIAAMADFLLDTTRAALYMARRQIPSRYADLKIILSHGAGFVPFHAARLSGQAGWPGMPGAPSLEPLPPGVAPPPNRMLEELQKFYFDLTSAMSPYAMPSIIAFAKPTHMLTGFDYPHAGLNGVPAGRIFDALPLADNVRAAITRDNGLLLSKRFARNT